MTRMSTTLQLVLLAMLWLIPAGVPARAGEPVLVERLQAGGHVLMIRHALAPGTGDPTGFRLEDCATQRNLNGTGREQARAIGAWLRERGIERARVYASQWCRCLETAELLDLGPVTELPALNSFYQRPQDRAPNLSALEAFLADQPLDGALLVLVTHQVTISAVTGEFTPSGHGALLELKAGGGLEPVGRLSFGDAS